MISKSTFLPALVSVGALVVAQAARADAIPYPTPGVQNTQVLDLFSGPTGHVKVWFGGTSSNADEDVLTVLINGVASSVTGPDNKTATLGQFFNFGAVNAGDSLEFRIHDLTTGAVWSTTNANNTFGGDGGTNHAYYTSYSGGMVGTTDVPAGSYFGFEDKVSTKSDFDYQDLQFYTRNADPVSAAPEPANWALMFVGFGLAGAALRRARSGSRLRTA